jgi:hypothetical protein
MISHVFEDGCGLRSQGSAVLWFVLRCRHFSLGRYLVAGLGLKVPSHLEPVSVGFFFMLQVRAFPLQLYTQKNILSTACRFVVVTECDRRKVTASMTDVSSSKCLSLIYMSCHSSYVTLQWMLPTHRRNLHCCIWVTPTAGHLTSLSVHAETLFVCCSRFPNSHHCLLTLSFFCLFFFAGKW